MSDRIRILIANGSVRPGNYTAKASALVADEFRKDPQVSVEIIDPAQLDLPMPGARPGAESTRLLKEKVAGAAGIVLATPEYHGSFSSVMKLVIENLGFPSVLAGKPVALLGVAAGSIGAIKSLEQLRSVCSHVGAIALPLPVSVANVQKVFDADGRCLDAGIEKLVRGVATNLMNYLRNAVCPAIQLERILREGVA
jgi:chromate reductase, NAD(P)H dehydrogenase (quinone)